MTLCRKRTMGKRIATAKTTNRLHRLLLEFGNLMFLHDLRESIPPALIVKMLKFADDLSLSLTGKPMFFDSYNYRGMPDTNIDFIGIIKQGVHGEKPDKRVRISKKQKLILRNTIETFRNYKITGSV